MSSRRTATCSCGQLKATCIGEPVRVSMCHCYACQKRTGTIFGTQARFEDANVSVEGVSKRYTRVGDEGTKAHFEFCPECGATVLYRLDAMPGLIAIPTGCFADKNFPAPWVAVYEDRRHPWAEMPNLELKERYN